MSIALTSLLLNAQVLFLWFPKFAVELLPSILSDWDEEEKGEEEESVNDNAEG